MSSISPYYLNEIRPGAVCFVSDSQMLDFARTHDGQAWSFHGSLRTFRAGNTRLKTLSGFGGETTSTLGTIIDRCLQLGIGYPSGHADIFHRLYSFPRPIWSVNTWARKYISGAWQAALDYGLVKKTLYKYDLTSAYAWAAGEGLPDLKTAKPSRDAAASRALFLADFSFEGPVAPYPWRPGHNHSLVSSEELRAYPVRIIKIYTGVAWDDNLTLTPQIDFLFGAFPHQTAKTICRSFWGRWASREPLTCQAYALGKPVKTWKLPAVAFNAPFAHTILSRVKMRLWEKCQHAVQVYVDSVITTEKLDVGLQRGCWRMVKTYPRGIELRGAGVYKDLSTGQYEKHSGFSVDTGAAA